MYTCPLTRRVVEAPPMIWAGLHDNFPDRPSAKFTPIGRQLATIALKSKTVTIPKGGLYGRSFHSIWDVSTCGLSCTRLADFLHLGRKSPGTLLCNPALATSCLHLCLNLSSIAFTAINQYFIFTPVHTKVIFDALTAYSHQYTRL